MARLCYILPMLLALSLPAIAAGNTLQTVIITFPETTPLGLVEGKLLGCDTVQCANAAPLVIQSSDEGFDCGGNQCKGTARHYPPYLQLKVARSNGIWFTSAPFAKKSLDASYKATLNGDTLEVMEQ